MPDTGDVNHCMNVPWCWAGVDVDRWLAFASESPQEYRAPMKHAADELGYAELPMATWRNDVCLYLGPRLSGYSGVDVEDLTESPHSATSGATSGASSSRMSSRARSS